MWSPADLVILVPMLGRPHRVEPVLESVKEATPGARVLFLTTPTDSKVVETIDKAGAERLDVPFRRRGDYARKINRGVAHTTEPLIFTGASDIRFHRGWFEAAVSRIHHGVGVVGTNDLCNRRTRYGLHSTHSLITRSYIEEYGTIDEPGKALHEGYPHEFVDDELVETARHRGAFAHAPRSIVEHLHPMAQKAPMDNLYRQQAARMRAGRALYQRRRQLWT